MIQRALKYFPFHPDLDRYPNVMVDSGRTSSTVLELSHWPGNRTPSQFKSDTSTEIVLKFLASNHIEELSSSVEWVSSDHYDIDGLLSVWLLTKGKIMLDYYDILRDTATAGDFDRHVSDESLKSCLLLYHFEQGILQPAVAKSNWDTDEVTRFFYSCMLPLVEDSISRQDRYGHFWEASYRRVQEDREHIRSGKVKVTRYPELDLAIFVSDAELSDFATNEYVPELSILSIYDNHYVLRYRYESFVETVSRETPPRRRLAPLVEQLNALEENGTWFCEDVTTAHPRLQLYANAKVPARSSLEEDKFVEIVLNYLKDVNHEPAMLWHPRQGWPRSTTGPIPPSMREYET